MKKIISFFLVVMMLVTLVSCGTVPSEDEKTTNADVSQSTDTTQNPDESTEFVDNYDGVFQVGFGRVDITPKNLPVGSLTYVVDPLYATCVAVHDGDETALIVTVDVKNMNQNVYELLQSRIKLATKVPVKNIMLSATHNHSAPTPTTERNGEQNDIRWSAMLTTCVVDACKDAIKDLSDAEIYTGIADTPGMAFVRRYKLADGTYSGIHNGNKSVAKPVEYESQIDDDLQMIRFARKDKKDIVLTNWQAHVAHAAVAYPNGITADLVYYVRSICEEKNDDLLIAYYLGASGNINLTPAVSGTGKYRNYQKVGEALAELVLENFDKLERVQEGKISSSATTYVANTRKESEETVKRAKELKATGKSSIVTDYVFETAKDIDCVISRSTHDDTITAPLGAISFGDIGFVSVPYEMFDTNGMEVKEGSPFKMTFVLTCAGGAGGYVPSALAIPHGGYEVYMSRYEYGTAEKVVEELLGMLNKQSENK